MRVEDPDLSFAHTVPVIRGLPRHPFYGAIPPWRENGVP